MCGRYATTKSSADLGALFAATDEVDEWLAADYNVAPTDPVPVVRMASREAEPAQRVVSRARWGLLPHWAKDQRAGARMINARAETVATSNAFARAFERKRCLVPADGWYEWVRRPEGGKQAYYMTRTDGEVLAFAGLWSAWGPDRLLTCSIVTTAAVDDLVLIHDRMPLVLPPERWSAWLEAPPDEALLVPTAAQFVANLELRPVGAAVGDVHNDGPELTARVTAPPLLSGTETPIDLTLF